MNLLGILSLKATVLALLLISFLGFLPSVQNDKKAPPAEQTSFSCEDEKFEHPVQLNESAMKALAREKNFADLLIAEKLEADVEPEKWFTASEIHLSSPAETDLIVMGTHLARGAYTSAFWVLRKSPDGYRVVFRDDAHDLQLQETRTNGFRNILAAVPTLRYVSTAEYAFDGTTYKIIKRTSEINGFDMSVDPAKFKSRKEFIQLRGQDDNEILAKARGWIWERWLAKEPAYVRVSTQDEDGEERDCSFFINHNPTDREMQIVLKTHRIAWDQDSPSGPRYLLIRDDLSIATKLERIEPLVDDTQVPKVISEKEVLSPSKYQLFFVDYWGTTLTL
jgi:hypothetical protein